MREKLIKENILIREKRPFVSNKKKYFTYENNGVFQICFKSKGCINSIKGSCIMCDYGKGKNLNKQEIIESFDEALTKNKFPIKILLLNTFGSILDENEMEFNNFKELIYKIKKLSIKTIIFETHYLTINEKKLTFINSELHEKNICFELGLESVNPIIRKNHLLKNIDNNIFLQKIELIHKYNMKAIANIIIGTPFLSSLVQKKDVINSINWCFQHKIDEVDLFPINVKPYTLLYKYFLEGKYKVISHWLIIDILDSINPKYLNKIFLAWYGNRELEYENGEISYFPESCPLCSIELQTFYKKYLKTSNSLYRKKLIRTLIINRKCNCYNFLQDAYKNKDCFFH